MASSIPVSASIEASAPVDREAPVSPIMDLVRRFRQHKLAVASVCVLVLLMLGVAIFLTVLSINFIGDGLRDAFDPRRVC